MGIDVDPASLRQSADAAKEVAEVLGKLHLGSVSDVASGMPGSLSEPASKVMEDHLHTDAAAKAKNMNDYAARLDAAAARYKSDEDEARRSFGR